MACWLQSTHICVHIVLFTERMTVSWIDMLIVLLGNYVAREPTAVGVCKQIVKQNVNKRSHIHKWYRRWGLILSSSNYFSHNASAFCLDLSLPNFSIWSFHSRMVISFYYFFWVILKNKRIELLEYVCFGYNSSVFRHFVVPRTPFSWPPHLRSHIKPFILFNFVSFDVFRLCYALRSIYDLCVCVHVAQ